MATYNDDPAGLDAALGSVVAQGYADWELVVCDDSTRTESVAVLEKYKALLGERMVYRRHEVRLGFVGSINEAISLARGELIARMDGDDLCAPDRLELQVAYLAEHPEVGILGGNMEIMSAGGQTLSVRRYKRGPKEIRRIAYFRNPLAHPTVMMRKSALDRIGHYDPGFKKAEDYELWLRALKRGVVIENLDRVLVRYRVAEGYSRKRDADNWTFGIRAKLRHFTWSQPILALAGIALSLALLLIPAKLLDALYARDSRDPILYG